MGCDIHLGIEHRLSDTSYWYWSAQDVQVIRDYELFGYLAGVRDTTVVPISVPRGYPTNSGYDEYSELPWMGEHTASWLTFEELRHKTKGLPRKYRSQPWYRCVAAFARKYGKENVRVVFNFDS